MMSTAMTSIMAVSADCYEIGFGRSATSAKRDDVVDIISGLTTLATPNHDLALLVVTLVDFLTDVPPFGGRVAVAISYDS